MLAFGLLSCFCFAQSQSRRSKPDPVKVAREDRKWIEQTLKQLSLEEKVGQMVQVRYYADHQGLDDVSNGHLREELKKYGIGSLVFGMHVFSSGPLKIPALDAAKVANQLQGESKLPLLIAADIERGVATRLSDVPSFPNLMAFGAIGDTGVVRKFAAVSAREARATGIQWALAPVADVNNNSANPVINDRSFGEDPALVGSLVVAYIEGAKQNGMLVTAKHFPGHGDSSVDSHKGIPSINGDEDHLMNIEYPPFQSAIASGVDSIMLAHAHVPALDADPKKIATTSRKIVTGLLRDQLGFKGIVVTDALEMKGITMLYDPKEGSPTARAAVDAVKAGCDVISIPTDLDGAFHAIIDSVRNGEIPQSRIDESVRRMLEMKVAVGLNKNRFVNLDRVSELVSKPEDWAFAQHVADEAMTLVRQNGKVLPLQGIGARTSRLNALPSDAPQRHSLIVVLLAETLEDTSGRVFEKEIMSRRPDAHVYYVDSRRANAGGIQVLDSMKQADEVVVAAYVVHGGARQTVVDGKTVISYGLRGPSGVLLQKIVAAAPEKTVVVALGSPYLISNFPQIQNYICAYAMSTTSEISAAKALFGEIQNHAKLPVTLPGIALRGFSLPWPAALSQPVSAQAAN